MAIIKKLSELEQIDFLHESSNIIIEENGIAKRITASAVGADSASPIHCIQSTTDNPVSLRSLAGGQYILNGFFTYNANTEEGVQFSNILVQISEDEILDEHVVCYFYGANYKCIVVSDEYFEERRVALTRLESIDNRVTNIDETSDDEHYPTAKAVYDYVGQNGGSAPGDFPAFEKIEGVVEYNEIAKATEVSTVDELLAFDGNAILRDYRHEGSKIPANTSYDVLKIPVQPGDVIRDMLGSYWKSPSNTSPWKYAYFYNANNTIIQNISIKYAYTGTSTSDTMVDYLDLRNNGLTAPDGASFVLLNLFVSYERLVNGSYVSTNTLQKCDIVTVNQPAELTAYDGTTVLEPYVPQDGPSESYYEAIDDVRIPRYEDALGDIETALDGIIATQESIVGGGTE